MPRSISIPERDYVVNDQVQRQLNAFPVGLDHMLIVVTRVAWPGTPDDIVMTVQALWSDGSGASAQFPGGIVLDKLGNIATFSSILIKVPHEFDPNNSGQIRVRAVSSATVTITMHQALRTAITMDAV